MQLHAQRHTDICLSPHSQCYPHTKYYVISFLVLPPAGDVDGISRLVRGTQGATKERIVECRMKGRRKAREDREMGLLGGFTGSGQENGPPLKFVSPSMGLEMIAIHLDTMTVKDLSLRITMSWVIQSQVDSFKYVSSHLALECVSTCVLSEQLFPALCAKKDGQHTVTNGHVFTEINN